MPAMRVALLLSIGLDIFHDTLRRIESEWVQHKRRHDFLKHSNVQHGIEIQRKVGPNPSLYIICWRFLPDPLFPSFNPTPSILCP